MSFAHLAPRLAAATVLAAASLSALADEALVRKSLLEHYPEFKVIDEVSKSPIAGLYEVHVGADIFYVDEQANYMIPVARDTVDGHIVDTKSRSDLTEERLNKAMAADIPKLPFKDAIVFKQGTGARRLVVFEDPNCHYCKDVEKSLVALKDVTIYTFLIPILGPDSINKSRDIWCAKDNARVWRSWMLSAVLPQREMGKCDVEALTRNTALAMKYRVNGTPAIIFEDGSRFAGAAELDRLSKKLDDVAAANAAPAAKKG